MRRISPRRAPLLRGSIGAYLWSGLTLLLAVSWLSPLLPRDDRQALSRYGRGLGVWIGRGEQTFYGLRVFNIVSQNSGYQLISNCHDLLPLSFV